MEMLTRKMAVNAFEIIVTIYISIIFGGTISEANIIWSRSDPPKGEISIRQEVLTITTSGSIDYATITAEYIFINNLNREIITDLTFPLPAYSVHSSAANHMNTDFEDFELWVEGVYQKVHPEYLALFEGVNHEDFLHNLGIKSTTFGNFQISDKNGNSIDQLITMNKQTLNLLTEKGLIKLVSGLPVPQWSIQKQYSWQQNFPPQKLLKIKCQYKARVGSVKLFKTALEHSNSQSIPDLIPGTVSSMCLSPETIKKFMEHLEKSRSNFIRVYWLEYLLRPEPSIKDPINNFELIVEGPFKERPKFYVSFCWDGSETKFGEAIYRAIKKQFVPDKTLTVYFCQEN